MQSVPNATTKTGLLPLKSYRTGHLQPKSFGVDRLPLKYHRTYITMLLRWSLETANHRKKTWKALVVNVDTFWLSIKPRGFWFRQKTIFLCIFVRMPHQPTSALSLDTRHNTIGVNAVPCDAGADTEAAVVHTTSGGALSTVFNVLEKISIANCCCSRQRPDWSSRKGGGLPVMPPPVHPSAKLRERHV